MSFSFGMVHDGEGNICKKSEGNIMSPTLAGHNGVFSWSACSRQYLYKFLRYASEQVLASMWELETPSEKKRNSCLNCLQADVSWCYLKNTCPAFGGGQSNLDHHRSLKGPVERARYFPELQDPRAPKTCHHHSLFEWSTQEDWRRRATILGVCVLG